MPDGQFRLTGIGRGRRAMLGFSGRGIIRDSVQVVTGSYPADHPTRFRGMAQVASQFKHLCKPGRTITGVVRDIDTGGAAGGNQRDVAVRAQRLGPSPINRADTGSTGSRSRRHTG